MSRHAPVRLPLSFAALLLLLPFFASCGGKDSRTPEDIARETVATLKDDNLEAYLELCISKKEMLATMKAAIDEDKIDSVYADIDAQRRRDFASMVKEIDWTAVQVDRVEVDTSTRRGFEDARLWVSLNNGKTLEIDDVFHTPNGWRIADDRPLRLR